MPNTMKSTKTFFYVILLAIFAIGFQSCQKSEIIAEAENTEDVAALKSFIATSMGISEADISFVAGANEFVISGDGKMSLETARGHYKASESQEIAMGTNGTSQRKTYYSVTRTKASALKIYVDPSVPTVWHAAIDNAIANWNNAGSLLYITKVSTPTTSTTTTSGGGKKGRPTTTTTTVSNYDMIVTTNYEASGTIATAYYPNTDGTPGKTITINTYHNGLADSYKTFAFTHEIGHAVGFTHTNGTYGTIVTGTPELDPNSVMNSVCLQWSAFTSYDLLAFRTVYPK